MVYPRLRDLREDADLTQKQAADLIGVSTNHYGKYERGETDIPLEKAVILANYYHVSLDYIAGTIRFKSPPTPHRSDADLIQTLAEYIQLSPKNQDYVDRYIHEMNKNQHKK